MIINRSRRGIVITRVTSTQNHRKGVPRNHCIHKRGVARKTTIGFAKALLFDETAGASGIAAT